MPRGGRRSGTPGKAYGNRTDLHQPVRTAPSESYGQAKQSADAQKAMPLPNNQVLPGVTAAPPQMLPGELGAFDRPTDRPGEPVTSGMAIGAGAGPSMAQPAFDPVVEGMRKAYMMAPSPELGDLLERMQQ